MPLIRFSASVPLFDREPISPSVPIACRTAVVRSGGQGRPSGRRANVRLALDGREPGGTLTRVGTGLRSVALVAVLLLLGGVGGAAAAQSAGAATLRPAPMSPVDAAVAEASRRFGVPESWIRDVMRVESAGNPRAVSHAGAIGLMQVMPGTYAELRARHGLGPDPFDVRDNVLAGTAYLREMFDRYGARGMLAAYNAGPGRWEDHLAGIRPLPAETVGYLARLGPTLDVGAAVAPSVAVRPRAPSPFEAPLFVALSSSSGGQAEAAAPRDLRQVIAANTTVAPLGGELFVRRPTAPDTPLEPSSERGTDAVPAQPAEPERAPQPTPDQPSNPLFPPRSVEPRR